jgi:hypothetical protein
MSEHPFLSALKACRCQHGLPLSAHCDACEALENEPQEGGRRELGPAGCDPETSGEPEQPRPLPSCDSPELLVIKDHWKRHGFLDDGHEVALLRMVDELHLDNRRWNSYCQFYVKECDALRAKLAEADKMRLEWHEAYLRMVNR